MFSLSINSKTEISLQFFLVNALMSEAWPSWLIISELEG